MQNVSNLSFSTTTIQTSTTVERGTSEAGVAIGCLFGLLSLVVITVGIACYLRRKRSASTPRASAFFPARFIEMLSSRTAEPRNRSTSQRGGAASQHRLRPAHMRVNGVLYALHEKHLRKTRGHPACSPRDPEGRPHTRGRPDEKLTRIEVGDKLYTVPKGGRFGNDPCASEDLAHGGQSVGACRDGNLERYQVGEDLYTLSRKGGFGHTNSSGELAEDCSLDLSPLRYKVEDDVYTLPNNMPILSVLGKQITSN